MKLRQLCIEDVCDFVGGSQPPKSTFINKPAEGYVRLIQTRDYKTDSYPTYIPIGSTKKFCDDKDIMIGRYGPPIFQICRGLSGAYNVALLKAVPNGNIDREYLYYFLKQESVFKYVDKLSARTGGQTGVDLVSLNKYPISLPESIDDQRRIVTVLSTIDAKINCNNRIIAELESAIRTLYDYWFVQYDFPDSDGNPYKSSGGEMVYNTKLNREIPADWKVETIGEYAEVLKGDLITANDTEAGSCKVVAAGLNFSYTHSKSNRAKNTITISGSGANAGYINFWREPIFASDCITVRGKSDTETLLLLHHLRFIQAHILKQATGSAQPHVYPSDIRILDYVVPEDTVIDRFGEFAIPLNDLVANNLLENQQLTELRDWLLPMLMNGQVTVA